jgi:hypothetical protein
MTPRKYGISEEVLGTEKVRSIFLVVQNYGMSKEVLGT